MKRFTQAHPEAAIASNDTALGRVPDQSTVDGVLESKGLYIENGPGRALPAPGVERPGGAPSRAAGHPAPASNAQHLGADIGRSSDRGGGVNWRDPNDPLKKAILGTGPKRPFGK